MIATKIRSLFLSFSVFRIFTVVLMTLKTNVFLNNTIILQGLTAFAAIWGLLLIAIDFFTKKHLIHQKFFRYFFVFYLGYCVTILLNYRYSLMSNLQDLVWFVVSTTVLMYWDRTDGDQSKRQYQTLLWTYIAFTCIITLCSIPFVFFNIGAREANGYVWGFYANRLFGLYRSPNYGALYCVVSLFASLHILQSKVTRRLVKIVLIANIVIQFLYVIYSGSNTGKVALAVCIMIYFLYYILVVSGWKYKVLLTMLACGCLIATFGTLTVVKQITQYGMNQIYASTSSAVSSGVSSAPSSGAVSSGVSSAPSSGAISSSVSSVPSSGAVSSGGSSAPSSGAVSSGGSSVTSSSSGEKDFSLERPDLATKQPLGNGRAHNWKVGLKVFRDYPIFGTSMRGYNAIVKAYDDSFRTQARHVTLENDFMSLLACTGSVGLLLMLTIMLLIGIYLIKNICFMIKHKQFKRLKTLWGALGVVGIIGVTMFFTDAVIFSNTLQSAMFWISLGFALFCCSSNQGKEEPHQ